MVAPQLTNAVKQGLLDRYEKLAERRNERNLSTFLKFDFSDYAQQIGESLILTKEINEGRTFEKLEVINKKKLSLKERFSLWYNGQTDIEKIGEFIYHNLKNWTSSDPQRDIELETKYTCLVHRAEEEGVSLKNPFQKRLTVVIRYSDFHQFNELHEYILYDRLTPIHLLSSKIEEILSKQVSLKVRSRSKIGGELNEFSVYATPYDIFKSITREPPTMFNPSTDEAGRSERMVTFDLKDPDHEVMNYLIFKEGHQDVQGNLQEKFTVLLNEDDKKKLLATLSQELENKINKNIPKMILEETRGPGLVKQIVTGAGSALLTGASTGFGLALTGAGTAFRVIRHPVQTVHSVQQNAQRAYHAVADPIMDPLRLERDLGGELDI